MLSSQQAAKLHAALIAIRTVCVVQVDLSSGRSVAPDMQFALSADQVYRHLISDKRWIPKKLGAEMQCNIGLARPQRNLTLAVAHVDRNLHF